MSDPAKRSADEAIPAAGATDPNGVLRLYDRLRGYLRTSNETGVQETVRELVRAGRPLAEIQALLARSEPQSSPAEVLRSPQYYWTPQWNVQPNFNQLGSQGMKATGAQVSQPKDSTEAALPTPDSKIGPVSRHDWVEEWRERQLLPHELPGPDPQVCETASNPDTSGEPPTAHGILQEIREQPTAHEQTARPGRRSLPMLSPIVGFLLGAVAVVSAGFFLLVHLEAISLVPAGTRNTKPPTTPVAGQTHRSGELVQQSLAAEPKGLIEPNVPDLPATIAAESTPAKTITSEPHVAPTDLSETRSASVPSAEPNATPPPADETQAPLRPTEAQSISVPAPTRSVNSALIQLQSASAMKNEAKPSSDASTGMLPGSVDSASHVQTDAAQVPTRSASMPKETMRSVALAPDAASKETPTTAKIAPPDTSAEPRPPVIDMTAFLARGDALVGSGDIASARLFYERAADAGNAQAAIRLGETFDPSFLARAGLSGVRGNRSMALKWYKRAGELGASEADVLVMGIESEPDNATHIER